MRSMLLLLNVGTHWLLLDAADLKRNEMARDAGTLC